MNDLPTRVIHSYLSHLRIEVIARMEKISVREAQAIVDRVVAVPKRNLKLDCQH